MTSRKAKERREALSSERVFGPSDSKAKAAAQEKRERRRMRNLTLMATKLEPKA